MTEHIYTALKEAREAKGLSQRALQARTGVPQSHISKIESRAKDIRLSSLFELARALDLELKLVPRKALSAVDAVVQSTAPSDSRQDTVIAKQIQRSLDAVTAIKKRHPTGLGLTRLQRALADIQTLQINPRTLEAMRQLQRPLKQIQANLATANSAAGAVKLPPETIEALQRAARAVETFRNSLVHSRGTDTSRPAYTLEDEDEEDEHA